MAGPSDIAIGDVLSEAFEQTADLILLAQVALEVDLGREMDLARGRKYIARELAGFARDRGKLTLLITSARDKRPDNQDINALYRELTAVGVDLGSTLPPRLPLPDHRKRFANRCDRVPQWENVRAAARQSKNELVFIPGAKDLGHPYFNERIVRRLDLDRNTVIEMAPRASYAEQPSSVHEMLEMMVIGLGDRPDGTIEQVYERIVKKIEAISTGKTVVFLSFVLNTLPAELQSFYTEWIPRLVRDTHKPDRERKTLRYYQPLEWIDDGSKDLRAMLRRWLEPPTKWEMKASQGRRAIATIEQATADDLLLTTRVAELSEIDESHLIDLCNDVGIVEEDRETLLKECRGLTTERKLKTIDQLMPGFTPDPNRKLADDESLD